MVNGALEGDIVPIVSALDGEVDVVVSGHRHAFTNAVLPNAAGRPVLVTQAFSAGTAYADIDLVVDRRSGGPLDPISGRVLAGVTVEDGAPLEDVAAHSVAVNSFLAEGGDGFTALLAGTERVGGPVDLDAFEAYVAPTLGGAALVPPATDRVSRVP